MQDRPAAACQSCRQLRPVKGQLPIRFPRFVLRSRKQIDVVFCGHLAMAPLGAALPSCCGVPLWVQVHGIEAWEELSWLHRRAIETASSSHFGEPLYPAALLRGSTLIRRE